MCNCASFHSDACLIHRLTTYYPGRRPAIQGDYLSTLGNPGAAEVTAKADVGAASTQVKATTTAHRIASQQSRSRWPQRTSEAGLISASGIIPISPEAKSLKLFSNALIAAGGRPCRKTDVRTFRVGGEWRQSKKRGNGADAVPCRGLVTRSVHRYAVGLGVGCGGACSVGGDS